MKPLVFLVIVLLALPAHAAGFAEREEVQTFITEMQEKHGLDSSRLAALFAKARPMPAVIEAIRPPTDPRIRSWQTYRARFIEPKRIAAGLRFMCQHRAALARAEAKTGVPAEIIAAIIGIETFYGKHLGRFDSFAALATLAFDYPPRAEAFRRELEALLLLARDERRAPDSYRGSYAGAIGLPQFLPSSIRHYAVDFDHDGRIDLVGSAEDAIGSVANFLASHGWEAGGPIAIPVKVGAGKTAADALIEEGILPQRRPQEMASFGVMIPADAPDAPAALIDLVTPEKPTEYWLGYQNFYVLTRYNRSSFYAMAVYRLAATLMARLE
ncbi:lytic murein transglycosylase B [Sulfuricystis multivorans]|uniref:lytic murein transglycosylase B n=1 Tax=Sulfuricystis multivorans TaxID=2211108 RepID=UPI000F82978B|nr:lytic murein transglycosylase B [Sulfuricystis multivorans]